MHLEFEWEKHSDALQYMLEHVHRKVVLHELAVESLLKPFFMMVQTRITRKRAHPLVVFSKLVDESSRRQRPSRVILKPFERLLQIESYWL